MAKKVTHGMLLQQPWARLVVEGVFPVLVRSSSTNVRGRVAVVARGYDNKALVDGKRPDTREFPQPATLGYVRLAGCVKVPLRHVMRELRRGFGSDFAKFYPKHYLPAKSPIYFWLLNGPETLKRPRPCNPLGARKWMRVKAD